MPQSSHLTNFKRTVWNYYRKYGRDLPWRRTKNPYHILVSEMMLQQTQVSRALGFYPRFLKQFPTITSLAHAPLSSVLSAWKGLGYNRRALALHRLAHIVVAQYKGALPVTHEALLELPGIGQSTAGAILAYAHNKPSLFIETNIRRIFIHHFFKYKKDVPDNDILPLIQKTVSATNPRAWYWALMDYGTYLAKTIPNPNKKSRHYTKQSVFHGSRRKLRGEILKEVLEKKSVTTPVLSRLLPEKISRITEIVQELTREGFITYNPRNRTISLI